MNYFHILSVPPSNIPCYFMSPQRPVLMYLYRSVMLYDHSVGSIPKQVCEDQEVIRVFFLLSG